MGRHEVLPILLIGSALLSVPEALSGQVTARSFGEIAGGMALKASYGISDARGVLLSVRVGRYFTPHAALRLEAEIQSYDAGRPPVTGNAPCPPGHTCTFAASPGAGPIRVLSALATIQYHEQADRRGFFLVAGLGPQLLASHPDRSAAIRLATQVGLGLSIGGTVVLEARYQPTLGARAEPRHVVLVSMGLRWSPASRIPD